MTMKNLITKCRVNFIRTFYFFLIISQDQLALQSGSGAEAVVIEAKSPCENRTIRDYEGVITSPDYPLPFPEDVECEWKIRSPPGTVLKINITDLDLSEDEDCVKHPCCSDHRLTVFQHGNPTILCGNNTKKEIMVYQPMTIIKYYSSRYNCEGRGFKLLYSIKPNTCQQDELPCLNGKCYPKSKFCNGAVVCGDGSDEAFCYHIAHTPNYSAVRSNILRQEYTSIDYSATGEHVKCKDGSIKCALSPGHCFYPTTDICNGKFDCPRGEDEVGCHARCPKQLTCADGHGCYFPTQRCNGMRNCRDNTDELGCSMEACVAMEFTCLNGACISGSLVCDGEDDCGDYSDEENCARTSFMKILIVGLFTCVALFCVVLGCLYHMYTSRWRDPSEYIHQMDSETPDNNLIFREPPPTYSSAMNDPRFSGAPEASERLLGNPRGLFHPTGRNSRRNRRHASHFASASSSSHRAPGIRGAAHSNDFNSDPKSDDIFKLFDADDIADLLDRVRGFGLLHGFRGFTRFGRSRGRNGSPCSSPSSSPSHESMTSCTSLEDMEDPAAAPRR